LRRFGGEDIPACAAVLELLDMGQLVEMEGAIWPCIAQLLRFRSEGKGRLGQGRKEMSRASGRTGAGCHY